MHKNLKSKSEKIISKKLTEADVRGVEGYENANEDEVEEIINQLERFAEIIIDHIVNV